MADFIKSLLSVVSSALALMLLVGSIAFGITGGMLLAKLVF